jgi:hypothetical protein
MAITEFKELPWHPFGGNEENNKNHSQYGQPLG